MLGGGEDLGHKGVRKKISIEPNSLGSTDSMNMNEGKNFDKKSHINGEDIYNGLKSFTQMTGALATKWTYCWD